MPSELMGFVARQVTGSTEHFPGAEPSTCRVVAGRPELNEVPWISS